MQLPPPLHSLLSRLGTESTAATIAPLNDLAGLSLGHITDLLELSTFPRPTWERELALVALWRAFLNLLPASVFERPDDLCRPAVRERLTHILGESPSESDEIQLTRVVKNLQQYAVLGRQATSLDYSLLTHREILARQAGRCASCGYFFLPGDLEPNESSDDPVDHPQINHPISVLDRSPKDIYRNSVLDHILPVYVAGDSPENWQILCKTCNSAKSDMLYGFEGRPWFGGMRRQDLLTVSAQLFYMVLNREATCSKCARGRRQVELRIIRKHLSGADLYTNLTALCMPCLISLS